MSDASERGTHGLLRLRRRRRLQPLGHLADDLGDVGHLGHVVIAAAVVAAAGLRVGAGTLDRRRRVTAAEAGAGMALAAAAKARLTRCAVGLDAAGRAAAGTLDVRGRAVVRGDDAGDLVDQRAPRSTDAPGQSRRRSCACRGRRDGELAEERRGCMPPTRGRSRRAGRRGEPCWNDGEQETETQRRDESIDGSVHSHACDAGGVTTRHKGRVRLRRDRDTKRCRFDRGQGSRRRSDRCYARRAG